MRRTSVSRVRIASTVAVAMLCAAPAHSGSTDFLLELGGVEGESSDDKHKNEIEILSYSWGATQTSHAVDGLGSGKVSMQDISAPSATSGGSKAKGEKGGTEDINIGVGELQEGGRSDKDMILKGSKIHQNSTTAGGVRVAAGDVDGDGRAEAVSPRDAASGLTTGNRMHKPVTFPTPRDKGSLTVRGKFPSCAVGTRYPTLVLGGRGKRFTLQDAIITSCGTVSSGGEALPMEEVSFNYAKIKT